MSVCTICERPSGLANHHPSCQEAVAQGATPEQIRSEAARADKKELRLSLLSSAKVAPGLALILFPICIVLCSTWCVEAFGARDQQFLIFCIGVGVVVGVLLAALLYNLVKLAAAVAIRVEAHINEIERENVGAGR